MITIVIGTVATVFSVVNCLNVETKEICYENVGCFQLGPPWDKLLGYIPQDPESIKVRYFLNNRNLEGRIDLTSNSFKVFSENDPVTFIIHGFYTDANAPWVTRLENALITRRKTNVITVDWSKGSKHLNYFQAVSNIRVVAAVISNFLQVLLDRGLANLTTLHLIGQSLGAHVAALVGQAHPGLNEITGLDPAQPWFRGGALVTQLDPSDARFVRVIHTNRAPVIGLGISWSAGHVDFYFNGGKWQPGCMNEASPKRITKFINNTLRRYACSHLRAQEYFSEALENPSCPFLGHPWNPELELPSATNVWNATFGQELAWNTWNLPARGSFYVFTRNKPPYCTVGSRNSPPFFRKLVDFVAGFQRKYLLG